MTIGATYIFYGKSLKKTIEKKKYAQARFLEK